MLLKRAKPDTIFGKIFLLTLTIFLLSLLSFYFGTAYLLKESVEENFKKKSKAEAELLTSYIHTLIKNYNYAAIYTVINQTVKEDPEIVGVRLKEFSSELLDVSNPGSLKRCKESLLEPCYYVVRKSLKGSIPIEVEVLFSTEHIANLVSSVRKILTALLITLFFLSEVAILLVMKGAEKVVNTVVEAIDKWKSGGIEELKGKKWSSEINRIVSKVIEMYEELLKEREIDYKLLLFTEEVLNILPLSRNEEEFLERITPSLKALFGFKDAKVCKENCNGGQIIAVTPKLYLLLVEGNSIPETVFKTLKNIISGAVRVIREKEEKEELLFGAVKALANAIDAMSPWTRGHSEKVAEISVEIGKALGLDEEELEKLRLGALLHDIGKLGIPPEILNKKDKLTPEEYEKIKEHSIWSYRILKPVKAFSEIIPIVLYHHERCDGSGYPEGLKCSQIPFLAKIVAVADVIEAMTAERPYKESYPLEEVLEYLRAESGRLFSPEVVEAAVEKADRIRNIIRKNGRGGGI